VVSSYQVPSSTEDDRVEEEGRENLRGDNIMPVLGACPRIEFKGVRG